VIDVSDNGEISDAGMDHLIMIPDSMVNPRSRIQVPGGNGKLIVEKCL
jgi:hypothetical protein